MQCIKQNMSVVLLNDISIPRCTEIEIEVIIQGEVAGDIYHDC